MDALESSGNLADGTRKNLLENIEHIALSESKARLRRFKVQTGGDTAKKIFEKYGFRVVE